MPSEDTTELATVMQRLGASDTEVLLHASPTVRLTLSSTVRYERPTALAGIEAEPRADSVDLVVLRELGRGGMGVVELAAQRSLERHVAIKTSTSTSRGVAEALVREARIMGVLEHPNIVPVHALGADANGAPRLVMKRVEGVTWRALLEDPEHPAWPPLLAGHGDRLRAQVEILSQVCRAIAFAHTQGILHRDLKPDNVMVGSFGEVYLLDWGIALRMSERAAQSRGIVGTPTYLAPEMARGEPTELDERTDVYLLGATLYELITGRAPHDAPTALGAVASALLEEDPPMSGEADAELVALVRAAMAPDKSRRLPSAEAFRTQLARFLVSRDAELVASGARLALARARPSGSAGGLDSASALRALIEARFGFQSAIKLRPQDPALRAELEATVVRLVELELALRSPAAARSLLADVAEPPRELLRRLEELELEIRAERRAADELAEQKRAADASKIARPLSAVTIAVLVMGFGFGAWNLWTATDRENGFPNWQGIALDVSVLAVALVATLLTRRALFETRASRTVTITYLALGVAMLGSDLITFALGRSTNEAAAHTLFVAAVVTAVVAATTIRQLWPTVPILLACVVVVIVAQPLSPLVAMLGLGLSAIVFVRAFVQLARGAKMSG